MHPDDIPDLAHILQRYLAGRCDDPELARDLVQESLLRAHRAIREGASPPNPTAWLLRIAHNLHVDHLRKAASEHRRSAAVREELEREQERAWHGAGWRLEDVHEALLRTLRTADPGQVEVVWRRLFDGLGDIEIANRLGLKRQTVGVRRRKLHATCKAGLRARFDGELPPDRLIYEAFPLALAQCPPPNP